MYTSITVLDKKLTLSIMTLPLLMSQEHLMLMMMLDPEHLYLLPLPISELVNNLTINGGITLQPNKSPSLLTMKIYNPNMDVIIKKPPLI